MGKNQNHEGTIKFIGTADFATGKWLGIALDGKREWDWRHHNVTN